LGTSTSFFFTQPGIVRVINWQEGYDCVTEGRQERSKPTAIDQIAVVGDLSATVNSCQQSIPAIFFYKPRWLPSSGHRSMMPVLRNLAIAWAGMHTIGSLSMNDVLRTHSAFVGQANSMYS
jgi:hypothetical protein